MTASTPTKTSRPVYWQSLQRMQHLWLWGGEAVLRSIMVRDTVGDWPRGPGLPGPGCAALPRVSWPRLSPSDAQLKLPGDGVSPGPPPPPARLYRSKNGRPWRSGTEGSMRDGSGMPCVGVNGDRSIGLGECSRYMRRSGWSCALGGWKPGSSP